MRLLMQKYRKDIFFEFKQIHRKPTRSGVANAQFYENAIRRKRKYDNEMRAFLQLKWMNNESARASTQFRKRFDAQCAYCTLKRLLRTNVCWFERLECRCIYIYVCVCVMKKIVIRMEYGKDDK